MDAPGTAATTPVDTAGHVAGDLPCLQCRYNLRTLATDARCPECGRDVVDTLAAVRAGRGHYLTALLDGVSSLSIGLIFLPVVLPPICLAAIALVGFGLIAITRRDPAVEPTIEGWSWRRALRASLLILPLLMVGLCYGAAGAGQALAALLAALPCMTLLHLRGLLPGVGLPGLRPFASINAAVAGSLAAAVALLLLDAPGLVPGLRAWRDLLIAGVAIAAFALLVMTVVFLNRVRNALAELVGTT